MARTGRFGTDWLIDERDGVNPVLWLDQMAQGDAASVCGSFRDAFTASACEARTAPSNG